MAQGVEYGAVYTLTGPDGTQAVFNDSTSPNFVGYLSPESSGLDSPDIREDAQDATEQDGGVHGNFYAGRRPVVLQGTIMATSATDRNAKVEKLQRASMALRGDSTLSWTPAGGVISSITLRRQQPLRLSKGFVKDFLLAMVAADPRIYGISQVVTKTYTAPALGVSATKNAATVTDVGGGDFAWTTPANAKVSDNVYATFSGSGSGKKSNYLLSEFSGFSLPLESVVLGIKVEVERKTSTASTIEDSEVKLTKAGVAVGTTIGGALWGTADEVRSFGGPTNLWGTTWTPTEINTKLGVRYAGMISPAGGPYTGSVDAISVTVYWEQGTETHAQTITNGGSYPTPPTIFVYGPCISTGFSIVNTTVGATFATSANILSGQYMAIDFGKKTAKLNGETSLYNKITFNSKQWWELAAGLNFLTMPPSAKVEIAWRDAWM